MGNDHHARESGRTGFFSGSCGSVASALDFQSLILSSIPGQKLVFLTLSSSRPV